MKKLHKNGETIYQFDKNKKLIKTWKTISEISKELNISYQNIYNVLTGRNKSIKGFIFSYQKEIEINSIKQFKNSVLIKEYNSIELASKQTGIKARNIKNCLNGINKSAGGFYWRYTKIDKEKRKKELFEKWGLKQNVSKGNNSTN